MTSGTIHLIAGTWASGKSTLAKNLPGRIPDCVIFDWDLIIPGLSMASGKDVHTEPDTWPGLTATWAAIVSAVAAAGRDVALLGPLTSDAFNALELGEGQIHCGYLDWPDETITERLRQRGATEAQILEELQFAQELRASPHAKIELAESSIEQMVARVADWIQGVASR